MAQQPHPQYDLGYQEVEPFRRQVLTAESIEATLSERLAYLSGGLDDESHPIVTVPHVGLRGYECESYEKFCTTLEYFKTLMKPEQISNGITLLLDARSKKTHSGAKIFIESLATKSPPIPLYIIYIVVKQSRFGRHKHFVTARQGGKLHLAYLFGTTSVLEQLDEANIITELGGKIHYDHNIWLHNRHQFEHAVGLHSKLMTELPDLLTGFDLYDVPKDVKDAEKLMQENVKLKERVVNEISVVEVAADKFMNELKQQRPEDSFESSPPTKDYISIMMSQLNELLRELKEKKEEIDKVWALCQARMDHMTRVCHFNSSAEKIQQMMQGHIDDLTDSNVIAMGDSLESALQLGEKHEAFFTKCKETMNEHLTTIQQNGQELLHPNFISQEDERTMDASTHKAISMVEEKVHTLNDTYQLLMTTCQEKRNLFIVCVKFHMSVRQCEQWYVNVLEFFAPQPMQEPTHQEAASLLSHTDSFLKQMTATEVTTMKELASTLPGEQFKTMMEKAETQYEQGRELLETKKVFLLKIIASACLPPPTPDQAASSIKTVVSEGSACDPHSTLQSGDELVENEEVAKMQKGRQFVIQELIATERDYIRDLECVLNSYYDAMDPNNMSIPLRLRGKRDIVFGNLLEIFKFHDNTFRQALEQYTDCPERVGECFILHSEKFQMYSAYCKNRSSSETLMNESMETQAFFKSMQTQLGQPLPLTSYLIKPIQRITKYQLLIKEMLKHSIHIEKAHSDLQVAMEQMLNVVKNLNDSLHVVGLRGFPGALAEQGRLLIHDPFHIWESSGRALDRFARKKERRIFLYEKVIIFTKKIEAPVQHRERKSDSYKYKNHVEIVELSLRETVENQPLQFELVAMHEQHKTYKLEACSTGIRDLWVQEIRRLLQDQFTLMKDKVIASGALNRATCHGKTKPSALTKGSRLFGDLFRMREPPTEKSFADRFKILKRSKKPTSHVADRSLAARPQAAAVVHALHATNLSQSPEHLLKQSEKLQTTESEGEVSEDSKPSDDEFSVSDEDDDSLVAVDHYESLAPTAVRYYTAISDYNPGESNENDIPLTQDQQVEVIGINRYGWWWVRATNYITKKVEEGWVPASYLNVSLIQTVP